jgi:branched-chain amino acid transport system ATP-binding protein
MLLLDEPSLGLAPFLVVAALRRVKEISQKFGLTVLIVEQKVREVLAISNRVVVLRSGRVSFSGSAVELIDDGKLRDVYL